jgi:FHA domain-containing protein
MQGPTNTDPGADRWPIGDEVIRLRQWATERSQALPTVPGDQWILGSDPKSWMQLKDESGRVSRQHAAVLRKDGKWVLRDIGSKNGIMVDGKRYDQVVLEPGIEVWLGGVTLVAESGRLIALRMFLSRLLGWTSDRVRVVDLALRSIRTATMHQIALVLCGDDDLVQLARALHRHIFGYERPFVLCDRSRVRSEDPARGVWNYQLGREALPTAKHGSLCVWNNKPPRDFADLKRALQDPDTRVQLIVCARHANEAEAFGATPITIPELRHRVLELPRIVEEYGHDATEQLGLPARSFVRADRDLVLAHAASTLGEIEKATLRLLAIREAGGSLNRAAERLGMARPPLTKWIARRGLPIRDHESDK